MGYTHYYHVPKDFYDAEWENFISLCLKFIRKLPSEIKIAREYDDVDTEPEFNEKYVRFNGIEKEGHETFVVLKKGNSDFNFCKTARKPYDLMVCACLIALKYCVPHVKVNSDGEAEDWEEAFKFFNEVEGTQLDFKHIVNKGD